MTKQETFTAVKRIFDTKGWNGIYAFERKNPGVIKTRELYFGYSGTKTDENKRQEWVQKKEPFTIKVYRANKSGKARNGFSYNKIYAGEIKVLRAAK